MQRGSQPGQAQSAALLEKQASHLYVTVVRFASFLEMNRSGFRKSLKKHDKLTDVKLSPEFMPAVQQLLPAADVDAVRKARRRTQCGSAPSRLLRCWLGNLPCATMLSLSRSTHSVTTVTSRRHFHHFAKLALRSCLRSGLYAS
jgi:SPX domain